MTKTRLLALLPLLLAAACGSSQDCDFDHLYSFHLVETVSEGSCGGFPELPAVTLLQVTLMPEGNVLFLQDDGSQNWNGAAAPTMTLSSSSLDDDVCSANMTLTGAWTSGVRTGEMFVEFTLDDRRLVGYATLTWSEGDCQQTFVVHGNTDE